ncbi:MAG: ABC transporter permease [Cyclobacteriaceae bacterium]|jgi:ABC-type transport system involved in multi-copper enzyme maturation permease subunit
MIRLFKLELQKNWTYPGFWIILGMHYLFLITVLFNLQDLAGSIDYSDNQYGDIDLSLVPLLQFPDIWHNITYISGFFKILLGIYVVIAITNEFQYNTIRLNLINGLTRLEFTVSKLLLIFLISLVSLLVVFSAGLIIGINNTDTSAGSEMLDKSIFLLGYFLEILLYLNFALLIGTWLKRTGISIFVVLIYPLLVEPLIRWQFPDVIDQFFPIKAMDQLIVFPFPKYVGIEVPDSIPFTAIIIGLAWVFILFLLTNLILNRKNL